MPANTATYQIPYLVGTDPLHTVDDWTHDLADRLEELINDGTVSTPGKVSKSGDTMTGNLTVARDGNVSSIILDSDTNQFAELSFITDGSNRWVIRKQNDATPDLEVVRFNASGGVVDTPFKIDFATGNITVANRLTGSKAVVRSVQTSSAAITLDGDKWLNVLTGTTARTFTLPAVSGNDGVELVFKNRASLAVNLTIQRAGIDQIHTSAGTVTSLTLAQNAATRLVNDGSFWVQV